LPTTADEEAAVERKGQPLSTTIWAGLSVGAVYGLVALLLTLPMVRSGVFNFAQAHYIVLGNFIMTDLYVRLGHPLLLVFVALLVVGGLLGAAQELLTIRTLGARSEGVLIVTVGMAVALEGFFIAWWDTEPRSVPFFGGDDPISLLGGRLQPVDLWLISTVVVLAAGLQLALRRTRWGLVGRAAMADRDAAVLRGVDVGRLRTGAFVLAGALACGLAPLVSAKIGASVESPLHLVIFGFAAAAVGGFGSFIGAMAGGFIVGLAEAFGARYLGVEYIALIVFGILAMVFLFRPTGLFGQRNLRVV